MLRFILCLSLVSGFALLIAPAASAQEAEVIPVDTIIAVRVPVSIQAPQDLCTSRDAMSLRITPRPAPAPVPKIAAQPGLRTPPMPNVCIVTSPVRSHTVIPTPTQIIPVPLEPEEA
jgi:hypothetical protein